MAVVEGLRPVGAAVECGRAVRLISAPELQRGGFPAELSRRNPGLPQMRVTAAAFRALSRREHPSGLAALVREAWRPLASIQPEPGAYWLATSRSDYPGNLGCIIRSAVAGDAAGVILLEGSGDPYHPEALRAAAGATFATDLVRCSGADLGAWAAARGVPVVGVAPDGSVEYVRYTFPRPMVLLLGAERSGIAPEHRHLCTLTLRIPMSPGVDSLNVCAAASIVAFEARRRGADRRR